MITGELKSKVDKLWETFWSNGISNSLSVIEQVSYLLFIKWLDDAELVKEKKANRLGRAVKSPVFEKNLNLKRFIRETVECDRAAATEAFEVCTY